ncbi:HAMP domain-containing sensor histidine kinase [Clostridium sp. JS66]|uniref:sensor histidine kinase n=1 Tax=Clostridium sp. JS66 TaxID=3064705 RepID=UPI00298D851F|nr:HAMP domain-containing sensor histidine kinase [Clostridium sp. JS66]WPC39513.1 HAMP domain-containing sensor histidine kinase [Clostridium sp. JS66]
MYLLVVILVMFLVIIFSVVVFIKLFSYKRQIRDIASQIREFRDRKNDKKINIEIADKDIEELAFQINEYLEFYKRHEQEKIIFEDTLKQGIANMSHDLRTPLTSIIGYLKLLKEEVIDKEEALRILKNKANKLNILINDFFELASIESEDYELNIERINITNIVYDEILSFYEAFESKEFEPKVDILENPVFIMGDKESLERIIDNLISNTLKYADKDIEINLEKHNDMVILKISNICLDIDKEDEIHIFDRFYMADKVRKEQGTGLGLSIVKSLMEKMNGTVKSKIEQNRISIICEWKCIN